MADWLTCDKTDPRVVARTVLTAVEHDESGTLFPDAGAKTFWTNFKADPASTLFVPAFA